MMLDQLLIASLTLSGGITGVGLLGQSSINANTPISLALVVGLSVAAASVGALIYSIKRDLRVIKHELRSLECIRRRLGKTDCGQDLEDIQDLELEDAKK
jgi:hypothetical protein